MSTMNEAMNYMADLAASTKFDDIDLWIPTWSSGTGGSAYAYRWGRMVTLTISNVTKLAVGNNAVFTLPEGYRPVYGNVTMILGRPGANNPGTSDMRMSISTNGVVYIYNYRTTAITSNPNAQITISFICNRTLGE